MRRRATIAAIALCGALAVSSAAPAFAAHMPVVSSPGPADEATDRRPGDDPKDDIKTELAEVKKKLDQLVAAAKRDAQKEAADTKKEAAKDVADAKKEAAEPLKGIASLVKDTRR
ncbi:hypothetical protein [Streptomyces sp. HUAS TT7]|uniref:hypothetical protein n=1 Tax=Streptomyces sp. HUAS TT7 TaxID=3447507 RepID=UPI003F655342